MKYKFFIIDKRDGEEHQLLSVTVDRNGNFLAGFDSTKDYVVLDLDIIGELKIVEDK